MRLPNIEGISIAEHAIAVAQDFQIWASDESLSYAELTKAQSYFTILAAKFDLVEEFSENGII